MNDMATGRRKLEDGRVASPVATDPNSAEAEVLVTAQQVLFSTAAAVALPAAKTRRWSYPVSAVGAAVRAIFAEPQLPRARRHYPKRIDYLENALMSLEMDRL
jgi:hypothetical protein